MKNIERYFLLLLTIKREFLLTKNLFHSIHVTVKHLYQNYITKFLDQILKSVLNHF